jgi:hypothetical protein
MKTMAPGEFKHQSCGAFETARGVESVADTDRRSKGTAAVFRPPPGKPRIGRTFGILEGRAVALLSAITLAALTASAQKPFPRGTMVVLPVEDKNLAAEVCWSDKNIIGVLLRARWICVERHQGSFNWSYFDQGIALAQANTTAMREIGFCARIKPIQPQAAHRLRSAHNPASSSASFSKPARL